MHKAFSPSTYSCSLCKLSHTNFKEKEEWKSELQKIDSDIEFLYKNAFLEQFKIDNIAFPIVAKQKGNNFEILLSNTEINKVKSISEFFTLLKTKITNIKNE